MALLLLLLAAAAFAAHGAMRGRTGAANLAGLAATGAFALASWLLYRLRTYRVLGLLGSLVLAALIAAAVGVLLWLRWRKRWKKPPVTTWVHRTVAGVLGALEGAGLVLVVVLALVLVERRYVRPFPDERDGAGSASARALLADMTRLLNRGLLTHLPVADRLGQALEDLGTILNAPPESLARAGTVLGLEELALLPTVQAAVGDPAVNKAIDDLEKGELGALYQLQASPRIQAVIEDPAVLAVVRGLTLADIARACPADAALQATLAESAANRRE